MSLLRSWLENIISSWGFNFRKMRYVHVFSANVNTSDTCSTCIYWITQVLRLLHLSYVYTYITYSYSATICNLISRVRKYDDFNQVGVPKRTIPGYATYLPTFVVGCIKRSRNGNLQYDDGRHLPLCAVI